MPRKQRQYSMLGIYHVVVKGNNNQLLFEEQQDYLKYLEILAYNKETCGFDLFSYCLMSNHVHLLIRTNEIPLDSIFRKINTAYAVWFNMKYSRSGPLQDGRYYSEPIEKIDYVYTALRYIHKNPLKAGLETEVGSKYPWSSYYAYIKKDDTLVDIKYILSEFNSIDEFVEFHTLDSNDSFIEINNLRKRLPDDVAIDIIKETCKVNFSTDVSSFSLLERRNAIFSLQEKGISARQINRLTGIPRGVVNRVLSNTL